MIFQILLNSGDQFRHISKDATPDALVGDLTEPPLHHVHPRTRRRNEVQMEAWMPPKPGFYTRMFVGRVVIRDEVQIEFGRGFDIDLVEEADEFLMPVARHAFADHLAVEHAEGRKQSGRAVALVVVRHRSTATLLQWETGLGAIEGLDLTFLVDAQNEGFVRWIEIESNNIVELLDKVFIAANLEGLDEMGLEVVLLPNTLNAHRTDALSLGHAPYAPVSFCGWFGTQRGLDNRTDLAFGDTGDAAGAGSILFKSGYPQGEETLPPQLDGRPRDIQPPRDVLTCHAISRHDYDLRTLYQTQRKALCSRPCGQSGAFFRRQEDGWGQMHYA